VTGGLGAPYSESISVHQRPDGRWQVQVHSGCVIEVGQYATEAEAMASARRTRRKWSAEWRAGSRGQCPPAIDVYTVKLPL
jgi:hypothetical protein